jgi:hypothetical protein
MTKHFWIKNPVTKSESYCVNFNGFLEKLDNKCFNFISISYNEVLEIINTKTKKEKYFKCKEIYTKYHSQPEKDKVELTKEEQSKLENIFSTHKNL